MFKLKILHPNAMTRLKLQPVMHGMAGILFLFNVMGAYKLPKPNFLLAAFYLLLGIGSLVFPFIMRKLKNVSSANTLMRCLQVLVLMISALFFLSHIQPFVALFQIIMALTLAYTTYAEYKMFQPAFMELTNQCIILPTLFSTKSISWKDLNNVILRDDVFTIDFKNNKVLQLEVLQDIDQEKMTAINDYCRGRLV
ncbi:hypothetical protein COR50_15665 [Chitinophaga caeni]|uniref:DUF5673 domain-containing protein n=1 Tax=Chitinophaga caeni TaxID=2029983 RepID=A0A291QX36_9BACT|nr:hypothetical protein [Chitinophaga caeni]ATL48481.1 hypothetical protein COR50_15665 [Chitinophaga caeni]